MIEELFNRTRKDEICYLITICYESVT